MQESDQESSENNVRNESVQESDQESSENDVRNVSKKYGEKLPFGKYFKGDKLIYPGNPFKYTFPEASEDLRKKLEKKLN